ncbi:CPBP family intramembrane metalloprotease [Chlamydiia bacterium]|nr:CPBP family intramembrane metalloprotease [Chlamydiia bacterium]
MYSNKSIIDLVVLTLLSLLLLFVANLLMGFTLVLMVHSLVFTVLFFALLYGFYDINERWLGKIRAVQTNVEKKENTDKNALMIKPFKVNDIMPTIIAIIFLFTTNIVLNQFITIIDIPKPDHKFEANLPIGVLFILAFLVAPITEEITFRGFINQCFKSNPHTSTFWTYAIPSFLFAMMHFQYPIVIRLYHFAMGLALVKLRVTTNSLTPPIVVHAALNAFAIIMIKSQGG